MSSATAPARRLGSFERAAVRFDRATPFNAAVSLTLSGAIDGASARDALRSAVLSHPIMTMAPSRGSFVAAARAEPEVEEVDGDEQALAIVVDALLNDQPRRRGGAPVRAALVHGENQASIVICAPHYLVDAVSLAQLLFASLGEGNAPGERRPVTPAPDARFPRAFKGWRGGAAVARYALSQMREEIATALDRAGAQGVAIPRGGQTRHRLLILDPDVSAKLSKACRQHGSTLNGALAAAVSRVFLSRLLKRDKGCVRLMSFCDLRRRIAPRLANDEFGAALAITRHLIRLHAGDDWRTAVAISHTIDGSIKRGDHFCASLAAPATMHLAFSTGLMRMADAALSLPITTWPKAEWVSRIRGYAGYVSVAPLAPPLSVIAAPSPAGLTLSFMYLDSEFDDEAMADLCDETARLIAVMAGSLEGLQHSRV